MRYITTIEEEKEFWANVPLRSTMKAEIISPPPTPPRMVTITMTYLDAQLLMHVAGANLTIASSLKHREGPLGDNSAVAHLLGDIYSALCDGKVLPNG